MMLTSTSPALHPQVLWSQRAETVTLVVNLQDAADAKIELTPTALHFAATSGGKAYAFDLDFYKEVSVDVSSLFHSIRWIYLLI